MVTYLIIRDWKEMDVSNYWKFITLCMALVTDAMMILKIYFSFSK